MLTYSTTDGVTAIPPRPESPKHPPSHGRATLLGKDGDYRPSKHERDTLHRSQRDRWMPDSKCACCGRLQTLYSAPAGAGPLAEWTEEQKARYRGLLRCKNVWLCLYCARSITEQRREELEGAMDRWRENGGHIALLTFTIPHTRFLRLDELEGRYKRAMASMTATRAYKELVKSMDRSHHVRGHEVTVSTFNGWHPHGHEMAFIAATSPIGGALQETVPALEQWLQEQFTELWLVACRKAGVAVRSPKDFRDHAVKVQLGYESAHAYVAKWGYEQRKDWNAVAEVTKGPAKRGRSDQHFNPLYLPLLALEDPTRESRFKAWFLEYAEAFSGRHQLVWSRGAKAALGILDKPEGDEEVEQKDKLQESMQLYLAEWHALLRSGLDGRLLDEAVARGRAGVLDTLARAKKAFTPAELAELEELPGGRYRFPSLVYRDIREEVDAAKKEGRPCKYTVNGTIVRLAAKSPPSAPERERSRSTSLVPG